MKRVVITGVNRGLGKELLYRFISTNYFVYGILRSEVDYKNFQQELPENSKLILADISSDDSIDSIQKSVGDQTIDLLINNAGIGGCAHEIAEVESSEISQLFEVHCLGVLRTVKALRKNLLKSTNPIVINLNSRFGSITRQDNRVYQDMAVSYSYRIAKAAQNMLTVCLRNEFKGKIQFISLHPGKMKTAIASVDADIEPTHVADQIIRLYKNNKLKEEGGVIELNKELIEW